MIPLLQVKALDKSFRKPTLVTVLQKLFLEVHVGEMVAIMGRSGEGKSTLLHILGSLEKPTHGEIEFYGRSYQEIDLAQLRCHRIGFVFQAFNLLEEYHALENVLMPAKIARRPVGRDSHAYQRALELLDWVGLSSRSHFPAKLLSGGEKQRVAIARALMNDPDLILADEPSGNLDSTSSQAIYQLLLSCKAEKKKTVIVVTHDQILAALCDRVLILKDGVLSPS